VCFGYILGSQCGLCFLVCSIEVGFFGGKTSIGLMGVFFFLENCDYLAMFGRASQFACKLDNPGSKWTVVLHAMSGFLLRTSYWPRKWSWQSSLEGEAIIVHVWTVMEENEFHYMELSNT
jgi:hypothetical protein